MITDRGFPHVSEVGPVCDEISFCEEIVADRVAAAAVVVVILRGSHISIEEFSEGVCAEAAL